MKISPFIRFRQWLRPLGLALTTTLLTVFLGMHGWSPIKFLNPAIAITSSVSSHSDQLLESQVLAQSNNGQQLLQEGRKYYTAGRFAEAATTWLQAQQLFERQGNTLSQATVLSNLSLAYRQLGQWPEAEAAINASHKLLEPTKSLSKQGLRIYGQTLNTQGHLYLAQGQTDEAREKWKEATKVYTQANYPEGRVKSLINQSLALRSLGFFRQSSDHLSEASELLAKQTESSLKVILMRHLGETERLMGNLVDSKTSLDKSLELAEKLNLPTEVAATQLSLGNTLQAMAQQKRAIASRTNQTSDWDYAGELYGDASTAYKELYNSEKDDEREVLTPPLLIKFQAQLNHLDMAIHHQKWQEVEELLQKLLQKKPESLLEELNALPKGRPSLFIRMKLVRLLDTCTAKCPTKLHISKSRLYELLADTREKAQALNDEIAESYALGYLGNLYETTKRDEDAWRFTDAALVKAHNQPSLVYQWEWQLGRLDKNLQRNRESVLWHYDAAFRNAQTVRKDLLYVGPDEQFNFRDNIEPLYRQYIGVLLPKNQEKEDVDLQGDPTQLIQAQTVIDDLRVAELESFLACGLIEPNDDIQRASIQDIAKQDTKTAIIYPIILPDEDNPGADRLEVLLQLPDKPIERYISKSILIEPPSGISTNANFSATEEKLEQFRKELERPYFSSKRGKPLASEIYDWLIRPAGEELESMETLVFILDGAFRNVPMAALYDQEKEQFLIEKYAIAVTFGDLQLPQSEPDKTFSILAAGLSEDPKLKGFGPLPFVQRELDFIRATVPNMDEIKNKNFTQESLEKALASTNHNVVHLATHGEFGTGRENTFIVATPPSQESQDKVKDQDKAKVDVDGKINLNELNELFRSRDLNPIELLVLSACETATGDNREVLGIAGISIQSGARSTLATLWSINDSSTSILMRTFYEQLVDRDISKAQALQNAQINLLKNGHNLSSWAPYLLVGDWR
ncbi:CHAT domain-containing protein [Leptothoe spongobia]|uniref:CHAT domain-containing protein n=1 Tax=Leptothoe spongobia TAU-MAC 1115 TaxID=1967444 RepID=A0A947DEA7_9CYAN|nr:CHAT domain-containing protein [Leptothoe spongobia]MBT9314834.1 CHAT domain-containing protein [Leptothoe spongobia TAU-MAC 1115]